MIQIMKQMNRKTELNDGGFAVHQAKRSRLILFIIAILIGILCGTMCSAEDGVTEGKVNLGQDISATVTRIRTWKEFDANVPADKSAQNWVTGNEYIQDYSYGSSKLAAGSSTVTIGESNYTMTIESFAPFRNNAAPVAKGRFWEIVVWFTNSGAHTTRLDFVKKGQRTIDVCLILPDKKRLKPKAFLIPSAGIAEISLITAWQGLLGLKLAPGEKTWLLLVFDVPTMIKVAQLQLIQAAPIKMNFIEKS